MGSRKKIEHYSAGLLQYRMLRAVFLIPSISKTLPLFLYVLLPLFSLHCLSLSLSLRHTAVPRSSSLPCSRRAGAQMRGREQEGEVLTTSRVYVCMVWPHRQLLALAGGEQATSRQKQLPSPTQLTERSRELRPRLPRNLCRPARAPKLRQSLPSALAVAASGDQSGGARSKTAAAVSVAVAAVVLSQWRVFATPEIPPTAQQNLM
jgi:hypothetical protein